MMTRKLAKEIMGWFMALFVPFIIIFFLNMKVFAISGVDQSSMHNTLFEGEVVYYNRINYTLETAKRGDIILFLANDRIKEGFLDEMAIKAQDFIDKFKPKDLRRNVRYIKRIIGLPGDVINIREGDVYVNGLLEAKGYVVGTTSGHLQEYPLTVPEGHLFVMGDNRGVSKDSRSFGCIDFRSVDGRAELILWPPSKMGKPE